MRKFLSFLVFAWMSLCLFISCDSETGLGEALDLTGPKISITSPGIGEYTKKNVTVKGTATDNIGVVRVRIDLKNNDGTLKPLKDATITGNPKNITWQADLEFEEGTAIIVCTAEDDAGQVSGFSKKQLVLLIDENPPQGNGWYIDRELNGIQYPFKYKEDLEKIDLSLPENKDAAQNVAFTIHGVMKDAMGVSNVVLHIDEEDEQGNRKKVCDIDNGSGNNYAPTFRVTHDKLVQGKSSLATGKHYLFISYDATDIYLDDKKTKPLNKTENSIVDVGCFLWWPESDKPRIEQRNVETENGKEVLNLHVKDTITLDVFDDDSLGKIYYALLNETEYSSILKSGDIDWEALQANPEKLINAVAESDRKDRCGFVDYTESKDGKREETITITAPNTPQIMHLVAFANDNTDKKVLITRYILTSVRDESSPILFISSPNNNSIPNVEMGENDATATFKIEGQTLDSSGCSYLEFVWVPDSIESDTSEKQKVARAWLESLDTAKRNAYKPTGSDKVKKTVSVSQANIPAGMVMWSVALGDKVNSSGYAKQSFSFSLDLFNDFGEEKKNDKFFEIELMRADGNKIYSEYHLSGDTLPPTIQTLKPKYDMEIIEYLTHDLQIEFKAVKDSGLGMKTSGYALEMILPDKTTSKVGSYDATSKTFKDTVPSETLQTWVTSNYSMPTFVLSAEDLLGNKTTLRRMVLLSSLPKISNITSGAMEGQVYKIGDTISISAVFTDAVDVMGEPKLKLKFNDSDTNIKYADYASGSGSNTLMFNYVVKAGDVTSKLLCYNEKEAGSLKGCPLKIDAENTVVSAGGSTEIHLYELIDADNLQAKKTIAIDGIAPKGKAITITSDATINGGQYYCGAGKNITATITADKDIMVQGNPHLTLNTVNGGKVLLNFEKVDNSASDKKIVFSTIVKSDTANGLLSYDLASCITQDAQTITDKAGNPIIMQKGSGNTNVTIDTVKPQKPTVVFKNTNSQGAVITPNATATNYSKNPVWYSVTAEKDAIVEVSDNGGISWSVYSTAGTNQLQSDTKQFATRATDKAGNISDVFGPIPFEIENNFPTFTIECTNPDGNYKAGSVLNFKVSFSRNVNIQANASAKIKLSGAVTGDNVDSNTFATLSKKTAQTNVSSVEFSYAIRDPDQFTLKVAKGDVNLSGISDIYGNIQNGKTLATDYVRDEASGHRLHCDGVAPKIVSLTPAGTKKGNNIWTQGNKVVLVFDEEISKGSGNIILQQTSGWAIPSVLSTSDFDKIKNKLTNDDDKQILVRTESDGSEMIDAGVGDATSTRAFADGNKGYFGSGQYVGPYKKDMHGLKNEGGKWVPDTSGKYVLAFDFDVLEIDANNKVDVGKTFNESDGVNNGWVQPTKQISTVQIRSVLEKAGYHQRKLDVTSASVVVGNDKKTVTITFPKGLTGGDALPDGREWELFIDKGAFYDTTGNKFGADSNGAVTGNTSLASSTTPGDGAKPSSGATAGLFWTATATNRTIKFWSNKVATPVVRVDRTSYGEHYKQANAKAVMVEIKDVTSSTYKPSGRVRVKIDCATRGATIKFIDNRYSYHDNTSGGGSYTLTTKDKGKVFYYSKSDDISDSALNALSPSTNYTAVFASGDGDYKTAEKHYIVAQATKTDFTASDKGFEGIYKTVMCFTNPQEPLNAKYWSIRGTTDWAGEPQVSPFPLRDAQPGTPYLKRCYCEKQGWKNGTFYWVSYEILCFSTVSAFGSGNYGAGWGPIYPGELSTADDLRTWSFGPAQ